MRSRIDQLEGSTPLLEGSWGNGPVTIQSENGASFHLNDEDLSLHILVLGVPGTGKTNAIFHLTDGIVAQLRSNETAVILDTKRDFLRRESLRQESDVVLTFDNRRISGPHSKAPDGQQAQAYAYWNVVREVLIDSPERREVTASEISFSLFAERLRHPGTDPFFVTAAQQLLAAVLHALADRASTEQGKTSEISNPDLFRILSSTKDIRDCLSSRPDAQGVLNLIPERAEKQTAGVMAELQSVLRAVFPEPLRQPGCFSVREFVRNIGHTGPPRKLFIEYSVEIGTVLTPVYRTLFDLALKEALAKEDAECRTFFIVDEFARLPWLSHMDDAINFGREKGIRIILGTQNVPQVLKSYPEAGEGLLSNFGTFVIFRLQDSVSKKLISSVAGTRLTHTMVQSMSMSPNVHQNVLSLPTVSDYEMSHLPDHHCLVLWRARPAFVMKPARVK